MSWTEKFSLVIVTAIFSLVGGAGRARSDGRLLRDHE